MLGLLLWIEAVSLLAWSAVGSGGKVFRRHVQTNWRWFFVSAAIGVLIPLSPALSTLSRLNTFLAGLQRRTVIFADGVLVVALVLLYQPLVDYWRRYRRSRHLDQMPAQNAELVASVIVFLLPPLAVIEFYTARSLPTTVRPELSVALFALELFLAVTFLVSRSGAPTGSRSVVGTAGINVYSDEPITSEDQDLLGRSPFVRGLYQEIVKLKTDDSFVFALMGRWGEGKTSCLNLLRTLLKNDSSVILVDFNPWYFANEAGIIEAFYRRIERALLDRYVLPDVRRILRRYQGLLSLGLWHSTFGISIHERDEPETLRAKIESFVERVGQRMVIVIDDIDRLDQQQILAVLKLARLSASFKRTIFVLSFDREVISRAIADSKIDSDFLDKIVQKPIALPPAEQNAIDRLLLFSDPTRASAIDSLFDEIGVNSKTRRDFDVQFVPLYQTHLSRLFGTLRQAKRFLNALRSSLPPVADEVNLIDFVLLTILQVFFADVYEDIWSKRWFYLPRWTMDPPVFTFQSSDEQERSKRILEHLESLVKDKAQGDVIREILETLFFELQNAASNFFIGGRSNNKLVCREQRRLTHPECFPKYFLLRVPHRAIPDKEVLGVIDTWNSHSDVEARGSLDVERYQDAGRVASLLEGPVTFAGSVHADSALPITRAFCKHAPKFASENQGSWFGSESAVAQLFLRRLTENSDSAEGALAIAMEVVSLAPLPFVASFVLSLQRSQTNPILRDKLPEIRAAAADRFRILFIEGRRDVFQEFPRNWRLILYQWATDWMVYKQKPDIRLKSYIVSLVDSRPQYLGQILEAFVAGQTALYDGLLLLLDADSILSLLTKHGDAAMPTEATREAARLFREHIKADKKG